MSCYRPRSAVYTRAALAVVFRVDASGVVPAAIRVSRNRRNLRRSANALEPRVMLSATRRFDEPPRARADAHGEVHPDLRIPK